MVTRYQRAAFVIPSLRIRPRWTNEASARVRLSESSPVLSAMSERGVPLTGERIALNTSFSCLVMFAEIAMESMAVKRKCLE